MKTNQSLSQGFSIAATLLVLALVAVGGVATYQVMQSPTENDEAEEEYRSNTRTQIHEKLLGLRAVLASDVEFEMKLEVSRDIIANIRSDLARVPSDISADVNTEIRMLRSQLNTLEADVRAEAQDNDIMKTIDHMITIVSSASLGTETDIESNTRMNGTSTDSNTSTDVTMFGTTSSTGSANELEVDTETDTYLKVR